MGVGTAALQQQVADLSCDFAWVAVAFVGPVAVDFPVRAGQGVAVCGAPFLDFDMGLVQEVVRAEVRGRGDASGGRGGGDQFAVALVGRCQFNADFEVDLIIEVYRHVPTRPGNLLRADHAPGRQSDHAGRPRSRGTAAASLTPRHSLSRSGLQDRAADRHRNAALELADFSRRHEILHPLLPIPRRVHHPHLNPDPFAFADGVTFQDEVGAKRAAQSREGAGSP